MGQISLGLYMLPIVVTQPNLTSPNPFPAQC